jgi:hypothetical protein
VSNVDDLCERAWALLDEADNSVLSNLLSAQTLATLGLD